MSLKQIRTHTFEEIIYDREEPCLVIFFRKDCHVCKRVLPVLEELQPKYGDTFGFYYVDVEEDTGLQQRFSLKGVPQILYFKGGDFRGKQVGDVEEEKIEEKILSILEG